MELKRKKSSNWIILFAIPILILSGIGFIAGFIWMYLTAGYLHGQRFMTKLSGFETTEEIINRSVIEFLTKKAS